MKVLLIAIALLLTGCGIGIVERELSQEICRNRGGVESLYNISWVGGLVVACGNGRTYALRGDVGEYHLQKLIEREAI